VAALHRKIGKAHPYEANRTLALLSKMFELARRWGFVPEGHPNPARDIDRFREEKRDRWVTPEELPRLAQAINEEPNESARFALWLYLLTGARKTELLTARWEHIDWTRAELKLPDTKAGRVHYLPLSAPALALLREIPRLEGNPFVLPGKVPGACLVNISKPWNRVRAAAGVTDVRLHDLRRTVGSWLAQAGNSLHLIGRVLNHSNQSTTAVYARFGEDSVRAALEQHGARIMGAAGLTPTAEITELPTRGRAAAK
jgi:integrase